MKLTKQFLCKLESEMYSNFTAQEWIMYFIFKAGLSGIDYRVINKNYDLSIMRALKKNFTPLEIKDMIDFLFECKDLHGFNNLSIYLLSNKFVSKVYNDSKAWKNGTYSPKKKFAGNGRNRDYVEGDSTSSITL